MRIRELINILEDMEAMHGNVEIEVRDEQGKFDDVAQVTEEKPIRETVVRIYSY